MILEYKLLELDASAPTKQTETDAGWDVYSRESKLLRPGEIYTFFLGIAISLDLTCSKTLRDAGLSYYWRAAPKSGLAMKRGIQTLGGVIDKEYRGNVGVILVNLGNETWEVRPGTAICQLIPEVIIDVEVCIHVKELDSTVRGERGFTSC